MASITTDHAILASEARNKNVPWYSKEIQEDLAPAQKLLEEYSRVPPDQVVAHIVAVVCSQGCMIHFDVPSLCFHNLLSQLLTLSTSCKREKAWDIYPYPCIGGFRFLNLSISQHPLYSTVLSRLKDSSQILLDIGCCFGQDIRRLVADGVPSEHLYGADLRLEFLELGYELFKDEGTLKTKFLEGNIFEVNGEEGKELRQLNGKIDIIHASSFLHLFTWDEQVKAGVQMVHFLNPMTKDALIIGRQTATITPGVKPSILSSALGDKYRHDAASFQRMWDEIGEKTGTKWSVKADLYEAIGWRKPGEGKDTEDRMMRFEVHKIQ